MTTIDQVIKNIEEVGRCYAEWDLSCPNVTWVDKEILEMIRALASAVDQLQAQVKELQEGRE